MTPQTVDSVVIVAVIAAVSSIIVSWINNRGIARLHMASEQNRTANEQLHHAVQEVHLSVNSRLDQWKQETADATAKAIILADGATATATRAAFLEGIRVGQMAASKGEPGPVGPSGPQGEPGIVIQSAQESK